LNRENRKISFSSINVTSINYSVIAPSGTGTHTFSGKWVDLLVQSTDLNEGTERWANVVGDSTIAKEEKTDSKKKSGSSSGLGSGVTSGEKYDNIAKKNVAQQYLSINNKAEYEFNDEANPITGISFVPLKNGGTISATIEVLKDNSVLAEIASPGNVYKNMNIWIGNDWASTSTVSDPKIAFSVDKEWIKEQGIDSSNIKLMRYTTKWNELPTTITREDENKIYFLAETPGFSPFAITAISDEPAEVAQTDTKYAVEDSDNEENVVEQEELPAKTPGFTALLGCVIVMLGVIFMRKIDERR